MLQIVYISSARSEISPAVLDDILAASRRNNAGAGVTGLLVAAGRRFLQALEGPPHAVLATFERIRRDDRHFALVELANRIVERRAFGDWAMAFEQAGSGPNGDLRLMVDKFTEGLDDANLRAEFRGFAAFHAD